LAFFSSNVFGGQWADNWRSSIGEGGGRLAFGGLSVI